MTCDKDKCTKCKDKFRINGKKCDACPANCDMCDAADGKCDADKCTKNDKGEVYRWWWLSWSRCLTMCCQKIFR